MTAASCQQHPDQAARGLCVRCKAPLCVACITKLDGINHCQTCLNQLAAAEVKAASSAPGAPTRLRSWLGIGVGACLLTALGWTVLNALLPVLGAP